MATRTAASSEAGLLPLFVGILGPPIVWAVRIATNYVLVPYACWWEFPRLLDLVTVAALVATAAAGWVAWSRWRQTGTRPEAELGSTAARTRFMSLLGMLSCGFFAMVIIAEGLANLFVHPCQAAGAPIA